MSSKTQVNYYYGSYINYKAIKDFHLNNNLKDEYLKVSHCVLLAFIIESFRKNDKMPMIMFEGEKYVLMNTNYILDNLIYLKVSSRMLKKYLVPLKDNGLIKIHIKNRKDRYINVHKKLIELCYDVDYSIRSISFLEKNKPTLWKGFVNEWQPLFNDKESFKKFIDRFNDTRDINEYNYNTKNIYEHLLNAVKFELYGRSK
ncbi:hypothetical protein GCM10023314_11670 [Algibacter agarivorans]|uniref:Uncharacterized protein n=1 Tax=Algibacter agarivorans TaxID=1109741 RepID=A0ABP9GEM0_9FLAO